MTHVNSTITVTLNNGDKIPLLGFGTGRSFGDEIYNAVLTAIKVGYRHFDTAASYKNEEAVGKAIRDSGIPRSELFVTTKLFGTQHRVPEQALDESLKRLGLDYVDLYLIHWPVPLKTENLVNGDLLTIPVKPDGKKDIDIEDWNFIKTWELVQELPKTGKTKAVGVSNFSINNLKDVIASPGNKLVPAVNQVELHPLFPQNELVAYAKENGILIEAFSPLGAPGSPLLTDTTVLEIASKYGADPAQVLINWALSRGISPLPKSVTPKRIESNLKTFKLEANDIAKLNNIPKLNGGEKRFNFPDFSPFPVFE